MIAVILVHKPIHPSGPIIFSAIFNEIFSRTYEDHKFSFLASTIMKVHGRRKWKQRETCPKYFSDMEVENVKFSSKFFRSSTKISHQYSRNFYQKLKIITRFRFFQKLSNKHSVWYTTLESRGVQNVQSLRNLRRHLSNWEGTKEKIRTSKKKLGHKRKH